MGGSNCVVCQAVCSTRGCHGVGGTAEEARIQKPGDGGNTERRGDTETRREESGDRRQLPVCRACGPEGNQRIAAYAEASADREDEGLTPRGRLEAKGIAGGRQRGRLESQKPVFNLEVWNPGKMFLIAAHDNEPVTQGNRTNEKIFDTDRGSVTIERVEDLARHHRLLEAESEN